MLRPIVVDVAALAKSREIAVEVVGSVVIAVRGCQHHARCADHPEILNRRQGSQRSSLAISPSTDRGIPPASIT